MNSLNGMNPVEDNNKLTIVNLKSFYSFQPTKQIKRLKTD